MPDPLQAAGTSPASIAIRWPVSMLIVAFPVFAVMARLVARATRLDPTKRASRIRRRLIYIVLFVASLVLIGDLTTLVYYFLGGEVTLRFLLKVLTVGLIAGAVFFSYYLHLRAAEQEPETWAG